jgi:hypothetical protein
MSEWISVEDELPEKSGYVFVVHKSNLPFVASYGVWGEEFTVVGGGEDSVVHEVTHWMPLPEPPNNN